jgi:hypothetical protein
MAAARHPDALANGERLTRARGVPAGAWLAASAVAVCVTFGEILGGDRVPIYRDLFAVVLPFRHFLGERLRAGDLPLWNPWIGTGVPFLATMHASVLYPPSLLLLLPFPLGMNLSFVLHYLVALGGAFAFFRARRLSPPAAAVGALVFALGGYLVSMLNNAAHLQSAAWVPWVLLGWERFLERPAQEAGRRLGAGAEPHRREAPRIPRSRLPLSMVPPLALCLLGGAPEVFLLTVAVLGARTLATAGPRKLGDGLALAAVVSIVLLVCAAQLLPTIEYVLESPRGEPLSSSVVGYWSLQPVSMLQLLFPHSSSLVTAAEAGTLGPVLEQHLPWVQSIYLGLVPLALAVAGAASGRERAFWCSLLAASLIAALGPSTPLFAVAYDRLPGVIGRFRYPEKFLLLFHLAASVLAAEGAETVFSGDRRARRVLALAIGAMLAVAAAVWLLSFFGRDAFLDLTAILAGARGWPHSVVGGWAADLLFKAERVLLWLTLFAAILFAERHRLLGAATARAVVVLVVAADLASVHYDLNLSMPWNELAGPPLRIDADRLRAGHQRVFHFQTTAQGPPGAAPVAVPGLAVWSEPIDNSDRMDRLARERWPVLFADIGMAYGIGNLAGGDSLGRARDQLLQSLLPSLGRSEAIRLLRAFGAAALIGTDELDGDGIEAAPADPSPLRVHRVRDPLPAAFLVRRLHAIAGDERTLRELARADVDPRAEAFVERLPPGWVDTVSRVPPGEVSVESYEPDRVRLRTRSAAPAFLVLNDADFPGWRCLVDGSPAPIRRTNALVRGVELAAGEHRLEFEYRPRSFEIGAAISLLTGLGLLGTAVRRARRRP